MPSIYLKKLVSLKKITAYSAIFLLAACGKSEAPYKEVGVKIGEPYEVNNVSYVPAKNDSYDKIGDASWYGPGFHGKRTASGEKFNQNDVTAAHPTLPMPSLVRVTNLANEQTVVVRINDRGPFHSNRIIDLSKKSAEMIDLKSTKPVRVEYLKDETEAYLAAVKDGQKIDMAEYNQNNMKLASAKNTKIDQIEEVQNIAENQPISVSDVAEVEQQVKAPTKASKNTSEKNLFIADARADEGVVSKELLPTSQTNKLGDKKISPQLDSPKTLGTIKESSVKKITFKEGITKEGSVKKDIKKQAVTAKFVILAGSFSSEENAKKLAKKLSAQHKISVEKTEIAGKIWWKVLSETFSDRQTAEDILTDIHEAGVSEARIVKKEI